MSDEKIQNLWGQAFRLVSDGLAERDVVTFVEKMMSQHRESLKQADHISTLHKLASLTVEEAQELASNIRTMAKRESEAEASSIISDAQSRAREILESAEYTVKSQTRAASRLRKAAAAMEALRQAQLGRFEEIDSELQTLKESARQELSTRMKSHYLGKHLAQSVLFVAAFEEFIKGVQAELSETALTDTALDDPADDQG